MLYLDYDVDEKYVDWNPGAAFNNLYKTEWFSDSRVVSIVEDIDGVEHVIDDIFRRRDGKSITARELSNGVKLVILSYMGVRTNVVYPLSGLGENCYKHMSKVPDNVDITFYANTMPTLIDWGCEFISKKTGKKISGFYTYEKEYLKYVI